jgi:hypothetical protein
VDRIQADTSKQDNIVNNESMISQISSLTTPSLPTLKRGGPKAPPLGHNHCADVPPIIGYRTLNYAEVDLINEIKLHGAQLEKLIQHMRVLEGIDPRWLAIGTTDLQTGLMALTRAVATPMSF